MLTRKTLAAIALATATLAPVAASADYSDNEATINRIHRDSVRGGPFIVGSDSPYLSRVRVCQYLKTPVYDPDTDRMRRVLKRTCWWSN